MRFNERKWQEGTTAPKCGCKRVSIRVKSNVKPPNIICALADKEPQVHAGGMAYSTSWDTSSAYPQTTSNEMGYPTTQYSDNYYNQSSRHGGHDSYQPVYTNNTSASASSYQQYPEASSHQYYPAASYNSATNSHHSQTEAYHETQIEDGAQKKWWISENDPAMTTQPSPDTTPAAAAHPDPTASNNSSVGNDFDADSEWQEYTDEHGRSYFYNAETGESKWERPAGTRKLKTLVKSGMFKGAADKRRCLPFVRDMVRNCSNKAFLKQFLLGPENYAQYINTNDVDGDGLSPFHIACTYTTRLDVLATLIDECGADIMHTTEDRRTALDVALGAGRVDISKFLMCRGGMTTLQRKANVVAKQERQEFYQDWRSRGLRALLPALGEMFRSDWPDFDTVIQERGGGYLDVLFRNLSVGHEDEFTVAAYMDDVAGEHELVKKWKLSVVSAQWNRRTVTAGKALQFRFKPPWFGRAKA